MDESTENPLESEELAEEEADVEGHGLKEGVAVALTIGALAIPATAQAYVPGAGDGPEKIAIKKQTAKKKHTAKPKPPLMPEERHQG
jgi:hypothetical protein